MKQVPINEKENKRQSMHQSESAVLLSYTLIITYRCYKDKHHFYTEPTSAGDKIAFQFYCNWKGSRFSVAKE